MKNILLVAMMATSFTAFAQKSQSGHLPDTSKVVIGNLSKVNSRTYKTLTLKKGDRFYFGYSNDVEIFKVVDFNDTGVFAIRNFQNAADEAHWFPFHDLFYSSNFKKLTK